MSLNEFRLPLLDSLLALAWKQWSAFGILGESSEDNRWVLDPEALLVFSSSMARYDARLFDEILNWVGTHGNRLDTPRLRGLLKDQDERSGRILGAILQYAMRHDARKWKSVASLCGQLFRQKISADSVEPLFKEKSGRYFPLVTGPGVDPDFMDYFLNRSLVQFQKLRRPLPINSHSNLRFQLRSLWGLGSRSECLVYLLTHTEARAREVADAAGLHWMGIQQTLAEMVDSELVSTGRNGQRLEYWVAHQRWWNFLTQGELQNARPRWLNWVSIFAALSAAWKIVDTSETGHLSDYIVSSNLQQSLEKMERAMSHAELDIPSAPSMSLSTHDYPEAAIRYIGQVLSRLVNS